MPFKDLRPCNRRSLFVIRRFGILLLLSLPLISCGRHKARKELEQNRIFAEILKREDGRRVGNDFYIARHLQENASPEVKRWCAIALGRIADADSLPTLHTSLLSADAPLRAASAFAIGELVERNRDRAPLAIPLLQNALEDSSISVRMRAVEAMGKIGSQPEADDILRRLESFRYNRDPFERAYLCAAVTALARLGNPAAVPLLERLADSDEAEIRLRAMKALASLSRRASLPLIAKNLKDPNAEIRAWAAYLMGHVADSGHAERLFPLLAPRQPDQAEANPLPVRMGALLSLGLMRNPAAIPAIQAAMSAEPLDTNHPDQLNFALQAAVVIANTDAENREPILLPLLEHSGPVADKALVALAALLRGTPQRFFDLAGSYRAQGRISDRTWANAMAALRSEEAIKQIDPLLQRALGARGTRDREILPHLLESLAVTGAPISTETWNRLIRQRDCAVLPEAVGINYLLSPNADSSWIQAIEAFTACNSNGNIQARLQLLNLLRPWTGKEPVRQLLLSGLNDPAPRIRSASYELLRHAGVSGLPETPDVGSGTITEVTAQAIAVTRMNSTIAQIETTRGTIEIELFREDAAVTVQNFVLLAKQGAYDGMELARANPFRIEGRIPQNRLVLSRTVNSEVNMHPFERGSIGMALVEASGDAGSYGIFGNAFSDAGGFFIALSAQPERDGAHTCFGRVVSGMPVADRLAPGDRVRKIHIKETVHIHDYRQYR